MAIYSSAKCKRLSLLRHPGAMHCTLQNILSDEKPRSVRQLLLSADCCLDNTQPSALNLRQSHKPLLVPPIAWSHLPGQPLYWSWAPSSNTAFGRVSLGSIFCILCCWITGDPDPAWTKLDSVGQFSLLFSTVSHSVTYRKLCINLDHPGYRTLEIQENLKTAKTLRVNPPETGRRV